jgi:membrane-bound lytic murein transglycosylase D
LRIILTYLSFLLILSFSNVCGQAIFNDKPDIDNSPYPINYPSLYYEVKIAILNEFTTLDLFYDETVQEYIDLFLTDRKKDYLIYRERSEKYFPLLERYLREYKIPPEIKYMAVLESGLSPRACSPSMAVGLWQFKEKTGSHFGLRIDEYHDERLDPELSTIAACQYLTKLYHDFNNWELSLLAYNAGPTSLRNAIKQNGGETEYTSLSPHLSVPAQRYLPALVALIYLFENHNHHF